MIRAIIDIGSNSVRLVVFGPPERAPAVLFNEKVTAALGRGLATEGALDARSVADALRALGRFKALADALGVARLRTVATAAVRDASNGAEFLDKVRALGLQPELLTGEQEAEGSGLGVVSTIPDANGVVGDLGGGSLELVQVANGAVGPRLSLPLGALRIAEVRRRGKAALRRLLEESLAQANWSATRGLPFYLVGGSWRALARLDMAATGHPLTVLHQYCLDREAPARLLPAIERGDAPGFAEAAANRRAVLGDATALLVDLVAVLGSSRLVVSAGGLREGLLYAELPSQVRALDPLLEAAREAVARQARFDSNGTEIARWIEPLFAGESIASKRIRHAACLLADVAWDANPDFRAGRARDIALHENWTGIDAAGRAMLAQALYASYGGDGVPADVGRLLELPAIERARGWGLALRLAQRLSGGAAKPLRVTSLSRAEGELRLHFDDGAKALFGEGVERRHRQLATALGLKAVVA